MATKCSGLIKRDCAIDCLMGFFLSRAKWPRQIDLSRGQRGPAAPQLEEEENFPEPLFDYFLYIPSCRRGISRGGLNRNWPKNQGDLNLDKPSPPFKSPWREGTAYLKFSLLSAPHFPAFGRSSARISAPSAPLPRRGRLKYINRDKKGAA